MKQYADIDTLVIWSWCDDAMSRTASRTEEQRGETVATIEYGYRRAISELIDYLRELDAEYEREQTSERAGKRR